MRATTAAHAAASEVRTAAAAHSATAEMGSAAAMPTAAATSAMSGIGRARQRECENNNG
jgi:hypothetical protein